MTLTPEQILEQQALIKNTMNKIKEECKRDEEKKYLERKNKLLFDKEINDINKGDYYE